MKQIVVEFSDEEMIMLEEQLQEMKEDNQIDTLEDYVYHATLAYYQTMKAAHIMRQSGQLEKLLNDEHTQVGVLNIPVQLSHPEEKKEFVQYLNQVINDAIQKFNNRNNGPIN